MKKTQAKKSIVETLSDEQKAPLLYGNQDWHSHGLPKKGLDPIEMHDGPLGLRYVKEENVSDLSAKVASTCFPAPSLLSCSYDVDLENRIGQMMALETRAQKTDLLLAPGINIKRNPLCGRNFEYFSEDPLLAGEMGAAFINGLQKNGVGASLKHYAMNSQETNRMIVDTIVDERALQEIYLKGFGIAVKKAQPWTVMCAYNLVNGSYCSDSDYLLNDVLRKQFGFKGVVLSDWGATNDPVLSHNHGLDLEMPCWRDHHEEILKALQDGRLDRQAFEDSSKRMVALLEKVNAPKKPKGFTYGMSHNLAREAITKSAVLLKNESSILPLENYRSVCVVGALAKTPRYQGNGSSQVTPVQLTNFVDHINSRRKPGDEVPFAPGYKIGDTTSDSDLSFAAVDLASRSKTVLYFMGLPLEDESEGYDRENMELPANQIELLKKLHEVNQNIVVVLSCGSPVELSFLNDIKGLLLVYLAGEAFGEGIDDLLLGKVSPSGKLAETWPLHYYDVPTREFYPATGRQSLYKDSIFVGYRFYASADKPVAFPFGYGLSYANFKYNKLVLSRKAVKDAPFTASLVVENLSDIPSQVVLELYVHQSRSKTVKPLRELKAFQKVLIKAHGKAKVVFELDPSIFQHFDITTHSFVTEKGNYRIEIGSSCLDIVSSAAIKVSSDWVAVDQRKNLPDYFFVSGKGFDVPNEEFERLLGHQIPVVKNPKIRPFNLNSTLSDIDQTWIGKIAKKKIVKEMNKMASTPSAKKMFMDGALNSPFRAGQMGHVEPRMIDSVLLLANGHFWKGVHAYLFGPKK